MNASIDRIVVIGAGGHAKVVIEAIQAARLGDIVGVVDPNPKVSTVLGYPILGGDEVVMSLLTQGTTCAVVALGSNALRQSVGARLLAQGFRLPAVVHPSAFISPSATVGDGVVIMARAVVGTQTLIRNLAIINTSGIVDHDGDIGEAAHVAPGCALAGNVSIGARSLVGVGSAIRPGIQIGTDAIVGAGSAVAANVANGTTVGGAPARLIAQRSGA